MTGLFALNWKMRAFLVGSNLSFNSSRLFSSVFQKRCELCLQPISREVLRKGAVQVSFRPISNTATVSSAPLPSWRDRKGTSDREFQKLLEGEESQTTEEKVKSASDNIISVPVHLEKRLERFMEKKSTKYAIKQQIIDNSRQGRRSQVVIHCKNLELNHYHGQTYGRKMELKLASAGWRHWKSAGDFFTLFPGSKKRESSFFMKDTESMSFTDLGIDETITNNLKSMGISQPTHIQVFGIPQILKGKRTLVAAETGCGKTLVYVLPILQEILEEKRLHTRGRRYMPGQPSTIILVPSRELADQVYEVTLKLTCNLGINVKLLQGGNLGQKLSNPVSTTVDILVATINAAKVLSGAGIYDLGRVGHVVLDEADTLLDDSFYPELVGPFLNRFPWTDLQRDMQLTLVSATMPNDLQQTLGEIMPVDDFLNCTTPGLHNLNPHVPQTFLRLRQSHKPAKILELVRSDMENKCPIIIFCNRSETCGWLSGYLNDEGYDCVSVHGRMPPKFRIGRMEAYKNGDINIIIATDLASRGIDTVRTKHVINYEFPMYLADYIHRSGRTGRVGSGGSCRVTNFIARAPEVNTVNEIEKSVRKSNAPSVNANIKRLYSEHYGSFQEITPIRDEKD